MEHTLDPELLQSIQELSPSDAILIFQDTDGRTRWTRGLRSRVIGSIYGLTVADVQEVGASGQSESTGRGGNQ